MIGIPHLSNYAYMYMNIFGNIRSLSRIIVYMYELAPSELFYALPCYEKLSLQTAQVKKLIRERENIFEIGV